MTLSFFSPTHSTFPASQKGNYTFAINLLWAHAKTLVACENAIAYLQQKVPTSANDINFLTALIHKRLTIQQELQLIRQAILENKPDLLHTLKATYDKKPNVCEPIFIKPVRPQLS